MKKMIFAVVPLCVAIFLNAESALAAGKKYWAIHPQKNKAIKQAKEKCEESSSGCTFFATR